MIKRFVLRLVCFFLALCAVPAAYFCYVQSLPAMYRGSLMGSVLVKQETLRGTEGARILVVGGSSVPYAIECETVAEQTGMPCIALGATAYLGIEYYLSLLHGELHEGDIVVLAPEFTMLENVVSYSTTWMAVENAASLVRKLPLSYLPGMASSYYAYSQGKLTLYRTDGAPAQTPLEEYHGFGFGLWGDIVTPRESILEKGYDSNNMLAPDASSLSDDVVRAVNRFAKYADWAGATVVLTWAPFDELAFTGTREGLAELEARMKSEMTPEYIGSLADCLMPGELFYNSNNHLTSDGAALRTQMLLDDMESAGILG